MTKGVPAMKRSADWRKSWASTGCQL